MCRQLAICDGTWCRSWETKLKWAGEGLLPIRRKHWPREHQAFCFYFILWIILVYLKYFFHFFIFKIYFKKLFFSHFTYLSWFPLPPLLLLAPPSLHFTLHSLTREEKAFHGEWTKSGTSLRGRTKVLPPIFSLNKVSLQKERASKSQFKH